jgi:L-alanine-DL-glutamate epimerase-like enolase superfamily enzyme
MRITRLDAKLLRLPQGKSVSLPMAGAGGDPRAAVNLLLIQVETDAGVTGLGFGVIGAGGRSLIAAVDELAPILTGENALNHERLWARVQALDSPAAQRAYAAVDIALWDLKAKSAGVPLARLLGGARESVMALSGHAASSLLSADDVIATGRADVARGLTGVRVGVRGADPEADSRKLVAVRDALGEEIWFAVSVENPFGYETALPMLRFVEEEIGADWVEDPLADDDLAGYAALASKVDTPLATGSSCTSVAQFVRLLETRAPLTLRPDVMRLGGLTPLLKLAAVAEAYHRPVVPRVPPEIGVHLACGLPGVQAVEYVSWLAPLFREPLPLSDGKLRAPEKPGLGIELNTDAVAKYRTT